MVFAGSLNLRNYRTVQRFSVREGAVLHIGAGGYINDGVTICATRSVRIGNNVRIADQVFIYDTDFHPVSPDTPTRQLPVHIGHNVWIGAKAAVLAGTTIGDNSVIAAGAVVSGDIPANCVAGGVPAKVIRTFAAPPADWARP